MPDGHFGPFANYGCLISLFLSVFFQRLLPSSVDYNQTPRLKVSDLDLPYLPMSFL